jgi:hypothetical protein
MNQKLIKMKKIGKLNISSEKMMKSDELVSLKGGYAIYWCFYMFCGGGSGNGLIPAESSDQAVSLCKTFGCLPICDCYCDLY